MAYEKISYELDGSTAIISFDDATTMNACGIDTAQELLHAFETARKEARCPILTGKGRGFCSGANLGANPGSGTSLSHPGSQPDAGRALETHYNPLILAIQEHPHPVITAVNGAAAGVGCALGLIGDLVICGKSGYFLQAMSWGLVNRVVEDDALMDTAKQIAKQLAEGPTQALALTRKLVWAACDGDFDGALRAERLAQRTAGRTEDFKEGVMAFLGKRKAEFKGK